MSNLEEAKAIAKAKRKEVAKVRIFWFLVFVDLALIIYIIIQAVILLGGK